MSPERLDEYESEFDGEYPSAKGSEESSESEQIRLLGDKWKAETDMFLAESREVLGEEKGPTSEAKEIVANASRLDKHVADRKRSCNTYDDEGNRAFVKRMTHNPFVKETRGNERCVKTAYAEEYEGWNRAEDLSLRTI